ncbi:MAG: MBL fold metallo-hydrolase [Armatimonadota bacterium]|nr:MBL fold metallo-hydrolase [Armatimonadota bacterium]
MTLTILGTAAAEGWPALWCPCETCAQARRLGGKNIRRRCAYQLGERIHVDFGPDSFAQMVRFDLDYAAMEHLLITHSHADHLTPAEIMYRRPGFVDLREDQVLTIYGNEAVRQAFDRLDHSLAEARARFELIQPFEVIDLGEGVFATPIVADHAEGEMAVNYLFERDGRTLLQGNDTGWWPEESWEFLGRHELDIVILECTYGPREGGRQHLGVNEVVQVRDELAKLGALTPDARIIATHFSHNGGWLHQRLEEFFAPEGIEVAFDGMTLEL